MIPERSHLKEIGFGWIGVRDVVGVAPSNQEIQLAVTVDVYRDVRRTAPNDGEWEGDLGIGIIAEIKVGAGYGLPTERHDAVGVGGNHKRLPSIVTGEHQDVVARAGRDPRPGINS